MQQKIETMDSINRNQPEDNREDLRGTEAGKKIKELAGKSNTCFFCTNIRTGQPLTTRPMSVQKMDEQGNIWFLSASDSNKNMQIEKRQSCSPAVPGIKTFGFPELVWYCNNFYRQETNKGIMGALAEDMVHRRY